MQRETVKAQDTEHLTSLISKAIEENGNNCDLNFIDVSNVRDMNSMFDNSNFDGGLSKWDVSNVRDMSYMFSNSKFTGDISKWDISNVRDMSYMFDNSEFNGGDTERHEPTADYMGLEG